MERERKGRRGVGRGRRGALGKTQRGRETRDGEGEGEGEHGRHKRKTVDGNMGA